MFGRKFSLVGKICFPRKIVRKFFIIEKFFIVAFYVGREIFVLKCLHMCVCMCGRKIFWLIFCGRRFIILIDIVLVQKVFVSNCFRLNFFSSLKIF